MKAFVALTVVVLSCLSCANVLPNKGFLHSDKEMDAILESQTRTKELVDCMIHPVFKPHCDPKLEEPHKHAASYSPQNACPTCTGEERKKVETFLKKLFKVNRNEHRRLVNGLVRRNNDYDYIY